MAKFSIANEEEAILELKPALVEKGYQFSERQKFWENFLDTKAPILRIPATYEMSREYVSPYQTSTYKPSCYLLQSRYNSCIKIDKNIK